MSLSTQHLNYLRKVIHSKTTYPLGTLVYFGPDDVTITKIVAIVILAMDLEPILRTWTGPEISLDPDVAAGIGRFFLENKVTEVVMTEGIVGCPHDEGVDYSFGEDCPHCPFWARASK